MDEKVRSVDEAVKQLSSDAMRRALSMQLENEDGKIEDSRDYPVERVQAVTSAYLSAMQPKKD